MALFGKTAKQWRMENPDLKGNIRDYATIEQLLVLTNIENMNAWLINQGVPQRERLQKLRDTVVYQMQAFTGSSGARKLNQIHDNPQLPVGE